MKVRINMVCVCVCVSVQVFSALSRVPNMRVYNRQNIPERFHYKGGTFVSPLTLVAEPGWFITEVTHARTRTHFSLVLS